MKHRLVAIALATMIGAAAGGSPARAASTFDGVYQGTVDLQSNPKKLKQCPPQTKVAIKVMNGHFMFSWNGSPVDATVGPDGGFSASGGRIGLDGRIAGSALSGSLRGPACTYVISAQRH